MGGTFSNSWRLLKECWSVLRKHKELVLFPIVSGIITIVLLAALIAPAVYFTGIREGKVQNTYLFYVLFFVFYFVGSFIVIFFNTGLISCAQVSIRGGDPSFSDGLNTAIQNIGKIFIWALINATVGTILKAVRERAGILGSILAGIIGVAWNLLTFFVIPVMIFQGYGVKESIKESAVLFKRTWGENVVARFSIGIIFFLLALVGAIPIVLAVLTKSAIAIIGVSAVVLFYWVALGIIAMSLNGILATALYDFATTGEVSSAFTPEAIAYAFAQKPGRRFM